MALLPKPSNDRPWKPDMARMPHITYDASQPDIVHIENMRCNRYGAPGTAYETCWQTHSYDLSTLKRLWFIIEPFMPKAPAIAHTFLSFEFEDDALAMSVEARPPEGQSFSILKGLLPSFELYYCFGDECDLILRRTYHLDHDLYLYPLITPPEEIRKLLVSSFDAANRLLTQPRFYNSVTDNCTSTLKVQANKARPGSFPPFMFAQILPGTSDKVLHKRGWIDTGGQQVSLQELRAKHSVKAVANQYRDDDAFSAHIRKGLV